MKDIPRQRINDSHKTGGHSRNACDGSNPSSTHSFGRNAKSVLELSRKSKAVECFCARNYFTSCGTEANNWILFSVADLKVKRIITSKIEHHAVLYTVQALQRSIQVDYVAVKPNGEIDITNLVELLAENQKNTGEPDACQ
jgi:cysteine desulfurase